MELKYLDESKDLMLIQLDQAQEEDLVSLLSRNLSNAGATKKTISFWRWKHELNPFGRSVGSAVVTSERGELIALRPLMRWKLSSLQGNQASAFRPVDTVTDASWRGRGIFKKATLHSVSVHCCSADSVIFNTPNSSSLPGYISMGWVVDCQLYLYLSVCQFSAVVSRFLFRSKRYVQAPQFDSISRGRTVSVSAISENEMDSIIDWCQEAEGKRSNVGYRTVRDKKYLKWRYVDLPNVDYGVQVLRENGVIVSVVFVRLEARSGFVFGLIQDIFYVGGAKFFFRAVNSLKKDLKAAFLVAHFSKGSVERSCSRRAFFIPVKRTPLVSRKYSADCDWDLSLSDIDVF